MVMSWQAEATISGILSPDLPRGVGLQVRGDPLEKGAVTCSVVRGQVSVGVYMFLAWSGEDQGLGRDRSTSQR